MVRLSGAPLRSAIIISSVFPFEEIERDRLRRESDEIRRSDSRILWRANRNSGVNCFLIPKARITSSNPVVAASALGTLQPADDQGMIERKPPFSLEMRGHSVDVRDCAAIRVAVMERRRRPVGATSVSAWSAR